MRHTEEYTRERPLRVATLCSGYDSQCLALERLRRYLPGFDYELVLWSEVDRFAIMAHDALFPQWADRNAGDMTAIDWDSAPDFDLLTYSTPCQSISSAGRQEGMEEGSGKKSSLLWNVRYAIASKRPVWLLMENVKAIVSKPFMPQFKKWCGELEEMGYANWWKVLNAKDYGVPQNRERVFMVSHLGGGGFRFPDPVPPTRSLCDVLEPDPDGRCYLPDGKVASLLDAMARERGEGGRDDG